MTRVQIPAGALFSSFTISIHGAAFAQRRAVSKARQKDFEKRHTQAIHSTQPPKTKASDRRRFKMEVSGWYADKGLRRRASTASRLATTATSQASWSSSERPPLGLCKPSTASLRDLQDTLDGSALRHTPYPGQQDSQNSFANQPNLYILHRDLGPDSLAEYAIHGSPTAAYISPPALRICQSTCTTFAA